MRTRRAQAEPLLPRTHRATLRHARASERAARGVAPAAAAAELWWRPRTSSHPQARRPSSSCGELRAARCALRAEEEEAVEDGTSPPTGPPAHPPVHLPACHAGRKLLRRLVRHAPPRPTPARGARALLAGRGPTARCGPGRAAPPRHPRPPHTPTPFPAGSCGAPCGARVPLGRACACALARGGCQDIRRDPQALPVTNHFEALSKIKSAACEVIVSECIRNDILRNSAHKISTERQICRQARFRPARRRSRPLRGSAIPCTCTRACLHATIISRGQRAHVRAGRTRR